MRNKKQSVKEVAPSWKISACLKSFSIDQRRMDLLKSLLDSLRYHRTKAAYFNTAFILGIKAANDWIVEGRKMNAERFYVANNEHYLDELNADLYRGLTVGILDYFLNISPKYFRFQLKYNYSESSSNKENIFSKYNGEIDDYRFFLNASAIGFSFQLNRLFSNGSVNEAGKRKITDFLTREHNFDDVIGESLFSLLVKIVRTYENPTIEDVIDVLPTRFYYDSVSLLYSLDTPPDDGSTVDSYYHLIMGSLGLAKSRMNVMLNGWTHGR